MVIRRARRRGRSAPDRDGRIPTWEEVARDEGDFIYTVAYRLTGNREDAQDLVQEVLVRVQRGLRTYRPGSLRAWLGRITTNAFLDDARRRQRRPQVTLPDDPDVVLPSAPSASDDAATAALPDHLQALIAELPEDYRVAVVLSDVAGLPYAEIAEELSVPVGTVRSRIHRGRLALRERLAEEDDL
ncbi:MAG: sigma-70 family RNA polymerase sigma factor [Acidimicrobiales bacterium]